MDQKWITCIKCGDEVIMPPGKVWCWQCITESGPNTPDS